MDILPTQVFEDDEFMPTQKMSCSTHEGGTEQVGALYAGTSIYPINKGINTIGRHPACSIIINDQTVSKQHAEIEAGTKPVSTWICDLNSSNKTKLNDSILRSGRCYELKDGSIINFGRVRAVYKIHQSMDDSVVPETPSYSGRKIQQAVIPGTPDSSLNDLSTSAADVSTIPGTQNEGRSVFRIPSLPLQRQSADKKNCSEDSSMNDSEEDSCNFTALEKNKNRVSTYVKKAGSTSGLDDRDVDIHDVETQKISLDIMESLKRHAAASIQCDIHDMETQHEIEIHDLETQGNVINIHEMETQQEDDVSNIKSLKRLKDIQDIETEKDRDSCDSMGQTEGAITNEDGSFSEMNTQRISLGCAEVDSGDKEVEKSCSNDTGNNQDDTENVSKKITSGKCKEPATNLEHVEDSPHNSQEYLKLSLTSNFEEELSEMERSVNLIGSQNLLENLIEEDFSANEARVKVSTAETTTRGMDQNVTPGRSTDDENIFDAATQSKDDDENIFDAMTQRVSYKCQGTLLDEDSETDEEGVFQRYSRDSQKNIYESSSKNPIMESEDSNTDEEGRFTEIAVKEKRAASSSFEVKGNQSAEVSHDPSSSRDSYDLFEVPTQRVREKSPNASRASLNKIKSNDDNRNSTTESTNETKKPEREEKGVEMDDMAPTQILQPRVCTPQSRKDVGPNSTTNKTGSNEEREDVTEMDDTTPTQIINLKEILDDDESEQADLKSMEEQSIGDIDYEMAPTQLISEVEAKRSGKSLSLSASRKQVCKSNEPNEVNLEDSVERSLSAMFDGVNEERAEESSHMSTEALAKMLQPSQSEEEFFMNDADTNDSTKGNKSTRQRKARRSTTHAIPQTLPENEPRRSNVGNADNGTDSRDVDKYFSSVTSRRKINRLQDSEDSNSVDSAPCDQKEQSRDTKVTKNNTALNTTPTVKTVSSDSKHINTVITPNQKRPSKSALTPKSLKRDKGSVVQETSSNDSLSTMKDQNVLKESSKDIPDELSSSCRQNESLLRSKVLEEQDDDILFGLPEVRISGTLSNPASPTSSISTEITQSFVEDKRGEARRKTTRKVYNRRTTDNEEPYRAVSNRQSSRFPRAVSNSFSGNLDVDKIPAKIKESDETRGNTNYRNTRTKIMGGDSCKSKANEKSSRQRQKSISSIDSSEGSRMSPTLQTNRRTRNSSKENVDRSSVFQVERDAPVESINVRTQGKIMNVSRSRKRSFSTVDEVERNNTKKRKDEKICENVSSSTRSRKSGGKIAARRQSANILDFLTKRDSPVNKDSQDTTMSKELLDLTPRTAIVSIVRLSSNTPTKLTDENVENETNKNQKLKVGQPSSSNKRNASNDEKNIENVGAGNNTVRRTRQQGRAKQMTSSVVGEESQEIEMILKNVPTKAQTVETGRKMNRTVNVGKITTRNTRKRVNTDIHTDTDSTESSMSSDLYESDNAQFDVPTSKPKRAKLSRANTMNDTALYSNVKSTNDNKRPSRLTRSSQQISDSSAEDSKGTLESRSKNVRNQTSRRRSGRNPIEKIDEVHIEENSSSVMETSMDTSSIISTPSRTRRSMSASFSSISSPYKVKHKILFTGITSDYSRLVKKLGASQVDDLAKCTVLVTDKVRRTVKFLCALAQSIPIVSIDWLNESEQLGRFVDLENYILKDPAAELKFGFKLRGSLEKAKEKKLLVGYTVVLTPNVAPPPLPELKSIIVSCGGKPLVRPPLSWPEKAVIISREEDLTNARKFCAKAPKTVTLQSTEFILTGILKQELDFRKYKLT